MNQSIVSVFRDEYDVWSETAEVIKVFADRVRFAAFLHSHSLDFQVSSLNVDAKIAEERERIHHFYSTRTAEQIRQEWHEEFHNFEDTQDFFEDSCLDNAENNDLCYFIESLPPNYQNTWQGEKVMAVALSTGGYYNPQNPNGLPTIVVQFGQQARAWISSAAGMYVLEKMLTNYNDGDERLSSILATVNIILLPLNNPDGHNVTWYEDRLWRKNSRINSDGSIGVDLNRNWNANWGGNGSSSTPSSENYHGPEAESEPEVHSVAAFLRNIPNLVGFVDVDSFGQQVLRPYAFAPQDSADEDALSDASDEIVEALENTNGNNYDSGKWYSTLYQSSGVAQDAVYSETGALSFTIMLMPEDEEDGGFLVDPSEIIPAGEEIYNSILALAEYVLRVVQ